MSCMEQNMVSESCIEYIICKLMKDIGTSSDNLDDDDSKTIVPDGVEFTALVDTKWNKELNSEDDKTIVPDGVEYIQVNGPTPNEIKSDIGNLDDFDEYEEVFEENKLNPMCDNSTAENGQNILKSWSTVDNLSDLEVSVSKSDSVHVQEVNQNSQSSDAISESSTDKDVKSDFMRDSALNYSEGPNTDSTVSYSESLNTDSTVSYSEDLNTESNISYSEGLKTEVTSAFDSGVSSADLSLLFEEGDVITTPSVDTPERLSLRKRIRRALRNVFCCLRSNNRNDD